MNSILQRRAVQIAQSFKDLASYSPTDAMVQALIRQGRIDSSTPPSKYRRLIMEYFISNGMKHNPYFPVFQRKKGIISLYEEKMFEPFVLANVFAGFLKGVDQYPAGLLMYENGFEQFSVFCHYTSIYQLINSFLQLHGICFIAKPVSGQRTELINEEKTQAGKKQLIRGTLESLGCKCLRGNYKPNGWTFVPCGFSHKDRWKGFAEILKKYIDNRWDNQIPKGVKRYYGYLKVVEEYRKNRWREQMRYSIDFTSLVEFKRFLNKSSLIIPRIRNEAIYRNVRYDIMERPQVEKGIIPDELMATKIKLLREFNEAIIEWIFVDIKNTLEMIRKVLNDDGLYFRSLNMITDNPIMRLLDLNFEKIQKSSELDKINKNIKEFIPLILPSDTISF